MTADPTTVENASKSTLPVSELATMAAPYNPRHDMDGPEFAALRAGITNLGVLDPVCLNRRTEAKGWPPDSPPVIVGGHQRVRAAQAEGMMFFPVFWVDLDATQEKQANIALNQIRGRWDDERLASMLREMQADGADLGILGFRDADLARMLQAVSGGKTGADDTPDAVERRAHFGDIWILGKHVLICGDSTRPETQSRLWEIARTNPSICVTDPPYGVEYDPNWRNEAAEKGQLSYSPRRVGVVQNDDRADWHEVWDLMPCDVLYHWCAAGDLMIEAGLSIQAAGFDMRASIIWAKTHFPIGRGHYTFTHEPCWYAVRTGSTAHWIGDKSQQTVWKEGLDKNVPGGHSTQKPVALFVRAIANHSGDVFEPFAGSGTCIIACEKLSRRCFAIEIDEKYCDAIIARWEAFTGEKATKIGELK